jgi:hypothetical protein
MSAPEHAGRTVLTPSPRSCEGHDVDREQSINQLWGDITYFQGDPLDLIGQIQIGVG